MSGLAGGAVELSDDELMAGFAGAALAANAFHHVDHVRVAWLYLRRYEPAEALRRYGADIRRLAAAHGAPQRYHETITWAYLLLIRERVEEVESWAEFRDRNPDLLDWRRPLINRYYTPELLASDRARQRFVLPDRISDSRRPGAPTSD